MRRCIYHTDLGQNAVFHCFSKQLYSVNIQDDQSLAFSETVQKISKSTYTVCGPWSAEVPDALGPRLLRK